MRPDELTGPVRATFSEFAQKLAAEGFAFLDARIREHGGTGPVLTCVRDAKIVGVIGPMEIIPDSSRTDRLLPQYFGVLPEYRGLGLGRLPVAGRHAVGAAARLLDLIGVRHSPADDLAWYRAGRRGNCRTLMIPLAPAMASWSRGQTPACPLGEFGVDGADMREDRSAHG